MTLDELLAAGESKGLLSPEQREAAMAAARHHAGREHLPWYLQAFISVGAWISSGFIVAFVLAFLGRSWEHHQSVLAGVGLVLIALAAGARWVVRHLFLEQACLAVSVSGHVLLLFGVYGLEDTLGSVTLSAASLATVLYFLYPHALHRFLSTLSALLLTTAWMIERSTAWPHLGSMELGAHLIALIALFVPARIPTALRPLGYAIACSLPALLLLPSAFSFIGFQISPSLATALLSGLAILATGAAVGGLSALRGRPRVWIPAGLAMGALALANGLATLVALLYLALGFRLRERALLVLGMVLAPAFTALHYYSLETTLWQKSVQLMISGAVLLALRFALACAPHSEEVAA